MNDTMKIAGGILIGATIGTGIGLMIAPASGNKSRKFLMKKSKKYSGQVLDAASAYIDDLKKGYNKKIESYASNGKSSIDSLKESIKA